MIERYSWIPIVSFLIGGLGWWSNLMTHASISEKGGLGENKGLVFQRREVLEVLDRMVVYQRYYHSVYGTYTPTFKSTGYRIPSAVSNSFEVRISEATVDKLLISASSKVAGQSLESTFDFVSINQDFQVQSNFEIPLPKTNYLKLHAMKHMRLVRDAPGGQSVEEQGVFKGFFKYEILNFMPGPEKKIIAIGIRPPVLGVSLELNQGIQLDSGIDPEFAILSGMMEEVSDDLSIHPIGQLSEKETSRFRDEAYLAQKIFRGELGRYAKSWSELSKIAHFKFEGKDELEGGLPFGDLEFDSNSGENWIRKIPIINRKIDSISKQNSLVIERIGSDDE